MEALSEAELGAVQRQLMALLLERDPDAAWPQRIAALATLCRGFGERDADTLLFLMVQSAQRPHALYSSRHALFCTVIADLCAQQLQVAEAARRSLACAALTMNLAMTELQDELVERERTPTLDQRMLIDEHPRKSRAQLHAHGVADVDWLEVVEQHHVTPPPEFSYADLAPVQRLAALLHRVDVFTAKISARRTRPAMAATAAARDACLGPDGRPDVIGSALMKVLGLYPPGSYVRLVNDEWALVTRRGARVNAPQVVSLWAGPKAHPRAPVARDTGQPDYAVKTSVASGELRGAFDAARVLGLT